MSVCEVDPVSGTTRADRYVTSEDCGVVINPMVVHGQVAGGVVQGIGGVLHEHFEYDDAGNPLTTTFLDYLLPTAPTCRSSSTARSRRRHGRTPAGTRAWARAARSAQCSRS